WIIMLAMLGPGLLLRDETQCNIEAVPSGVVVHGPRAIDAQHVVTAMKNEVGAVHIFQHAMQGERFIDLLHLGHRLAAEHPAYMAGQSVVVSACFPRVVKIPDRAMGNAGSNAWLHRAGPGSIVATETRP